MNSSKIILMSFMYGCFGMAFPVYNTQTVGVEHGDGAASAVLIEQDRNKSLNHLDHKCTVLTIHALYQKFGDELRGLCDGGKDILNQILPRSEFFYVKPTGLFYGEYEEQSAGMVSLLPANPEVGQHAPILQITLRGTKNRADAIADAKFLKQYVPEIDAYAHRGFVNRGRDLKDSMMRAIRNILRKNRLSMRDVKIRFTGHSLGGALALYHGTMLKVQNPNLDVGVVSYNAPRLFDHKGADKATEILGKDNIIRYWRDGDIVSGVSIGGFLGDSGYFTGYKHAGTNVKLDRKDNGVLGLGNHSSGHSLKDALEDASVNIDTNHIGFKDRMKKKARQIVGKIKDTGSKIKDAISNATGTAFNYVRSWF